MQCLLCQVVECAAVLEGVVFLSTLVHVLSLLTLLSSVSPGPGLRVELIAEMRSAVKDLFRQYYQHTRQKPEAIVYYR